MVLFYTAFLGSMYFSLVLFHFHDNEPWHYHIDLLLVLLLLLLGFPSSRLGFLEMGGVAYLGPCHTYCSCRQLVMAILAVFNSSPLPAVAIEKVCTYDISLVWTLLLDHKLAFIIDMLWYLIQLFGWLGRTPALYVSTLLQSNSPGIDYIFSVVCCHSSSYDPSYLYFQASLVLFSAAHSSPRSLVFGLFVCLSVSLETKSDVYSIKWYLNPTYLPTYVIVVMVVTVVTVVTAGIK